MLVGKWTYTKAIKNGDTRTAEDLADQSIKITKASWTLNGPMKFVMDYKIDTKSKPNKIKFTITESPFGAGMSAGGVIKMEGDQLVVCYSPMGKPPTDFAAKAGSGHHTFFLKKSETKKKIRRDCDWKKRDSRYSTSVFSHARPSGTIGAFFRMTQTGNASLMMRPVLSRSAKDGCHLALQPL